MKAKANKPYDFHEETDRMVNEGLGNGTVNPKYAETHEKIKAKEALPSALAAEEQEPEKGGDLT